MNRNRSDAGPARHGPNRRDVLTVVGAAMSDPLLGGTAVIAEPVRMLTRPIPSTGEMLPVIGCGTWQTFDVGADRSRRAQLAQVLSTLFEAGGSVVDSSPMYGSSEEVAGSLLAEAGTRPRAFAATKVWTRGRDAGIAQMRRSLQLFGSGRIDLMQVHNLVDWRTHLATIRDWKAAGRIRYAGVTHYTSSAYGELEGVLRSETLDCVQVNYAADDRAAEARILPLAAERGLAVIVNLPFGGGGLLRRLSGRAMPSWAAQLGCRTWAQLLLKFVLSHPAVTCAIPGTSSPVHMRDNAAAGTGPMPDDEMRERIAAAVAA